MSRRVAIVEDEFDDDTDIPLPSRPLPHTGTRGPILEQIGDSDDDEAASTSNPVSPAKPQFRPQAGAPPGAPINTVTDITPYKTWTCIYPIYIDAKRPYGAGQRRVAREKSVWWPLSKDIADASTRLGLQVLHEVNKAHPRDWDNPGRVRVLWKKDGRLMNPIIKTKKQLLEAITFQIHHLKPDTVPAPPYNFMRAAPPPAAAKEKEKEKGSAKGKQPAIKPAAAPAPTPARQHLPIPPEPLPPLASRVSTYSPAIPTGMLVEAVKAGMSAQQAEGAAPGTPGAGAPASAMKGKRKVVRVRQ